LQKQYRSNLFVRFEVITAASKKVVVFSDVAPCSMVKFDGRFTALLMEQASKHLWYVSEVRDKKVQRRRR
jgi:hypothetical protein